ncbi:unnamed protein product, partial [Cochlearia groenlandica]
MENYSDITPSTKTMLGWRERTPTSHSLKIKNFSEFEKSTLPNDGKYQSRLFSSGGYNWRMTIYPKGNDKDNGIGFISMYVEIDTTSPTSIIPSELLADLRFYVYNNKQKKYLTIQDVESKPFNILRTTWGIPKLYPKGNSKVTDGKWLSFFLELASTETLEDDEKIFARVHLRVLDPFGNNHVAKKS